MAKNRLLVIFTVLIVLVVFVVLGSTVFTLQKAELYFVAYDAKTQKTVYVDAPENYSDINVSSLIADAKGKSIFFYPASKLISKIQTAYPYLRVVGTQRLFPDKIELYVTEREPVAYTSVDGAYYLLDSSLFVLETSATPYFGYIGIDFGAGVLDKTQTAGTALSFSKNAERIDQMTAVLSGLWQIYYDVPQMPTLVRSMRFDVYKNKESVVIETQTGANIWLVSPQKSTAAKQLSAGYGIYSKQGVKDNTAAGVQIYCFDPDSGNAITN